jgi:hypothetical protein
MHRVSRLHGTPLRLRGGTRDGESAGARRARHARPLVELRPPAADGQAPMHPRLAPRALHPRVHGTGGAGVQLPAVEAAARSRTAAIATTDDRRLDRDYRQRRRRRLQPRARSDQLRGRHLLAQHGLAGGAAERRPPAVGRSRVPQKRGARLAPGPPKHRLRRLPTSCRPCRACRRRPRRPAPSPASRRRSPRS